MFNRKAEIGIGTLIIFIALILIATISASILITSSTTIQDKAKDTAKDATNFLTGMDIVEITATDGTSGYLRTFQILAKLSPSSEPINFDSTVITLNLFDRSTTLVYRNGITSYDELNGYYTSGDSGYYTISYVTANSNQITGKLQKDDLVKIYLYAPRNINSDENIRFNFIPQSGTSKKIEFQTPTAISNKLELLYP